jgi:Zinc finger domain/Zinc finger C-x8-C-x5-C-x3-H type (and similar)/RNA-binding, Nab2-type zinc finger
MASRMLSTTKPCAFFLKGQCNRGDDCHYSHTMPLRETRGLSDTPKPFFASQPCKFFQRGRCTNPNCPFVHSLVDSHLGIVGTTLAGGQTQVSANHCRFHLQGRCQNGDSCRFSHAPRLPGFEATPQAIPPKQSHKVAIQHPHSLPTVKSGAIVRPASACYFIQAQHRLVLAGKRSLSSAYGC